MMRRIDWPKFTQIINAKIGMLRMTAEQFPDGPAAVAYERDVFCEAFALLAEFTEATGSKEQFDKFTPEAVAAMAAYASAPLGSEPPGTITGFELHGDGGRIGEG